MPPEVNSSVDMPKQKKINPSAGFSGPRYQLSVHFLALPTKLLEDRLHLIHPLWVNTQHTKQEMFID